MDTCGLGSRSRHSRAGRASAGEMDTCRTRQTDHPSRHRRRLARATHAGERRSGTRVADRDRRPRVSGRAFAGNAAAVLEALPRAMFRVDRQPSRPAERAGAASSDIARRPMWRGMSGYASGRPDPQDAGLPTEPRGRGRDRRHRHSRYVPGRAPERPPVLVVPDDPEIVDTMAKRRTERDWRDHSGWSHEAASRHAGIVMHRLTDFKNFARAELDLFKPLTVLLGRNGSGKTNLIEGIELLATLARGVPFNEITDIDRGGTFEVRGGLRSCIRFGGKKLGLRFNKAVVHFDGKSRPVDYFIEIAPRGKNDVQLSRETLRIGDRSLFDAVNSGGELMEVRYDNFSRGPNPRATAYKIIFPSITWLGSHHSEPPAPSSSCS